MSALLTPLSVTFGDKICPYCHLTVAEYVNGRTYRCPDGQKSFVHDGCLRQIHPEHSLTHPPFSSPRRKTHA